MIPPDLFLPLIIFFARVVETSLDTIRMVYVTKGHPYLAAGIGVVKIGIWLVSTGLVLTNFTNIPGILAYIAGYGVGTLIGMNIEERISIGNVLVRIITPKDPESLIAQLAGIGFGITRVNAAGSFTQSVAILLMVVPRTELDRLLAVLKKDYPDLLFTVEDIRKMSEQGTIFYGKRRGGLRRFLGMD